MAKQWVVQDQVPRDVIAVFDRKVDAEQFVKTRNYSDAYEIHEVNYISKENLQDMTDMLEGDVPNEHLRREAMNASVELADL